MKKIKVGKLIKRAFFVCFLLFVTLATVFVSPKPASAYIGLGYVDARQAYTDNFFGKTVAQLIYDEGAQHNINPRLILVMLQRESASITQSTPSSNTRRSWPLFYNFDERMADCFNGNDASCTDIKYGKPDYSYRAEQYGGVGQQIAYATARLSSLDADGCSSGFATDNNASCALYTYTPHLESYDTNSAFYQNWVSWWGGTPNGGAYSPTNIISEANFRGQTMSAADINNFLAGKGSWLANYVIPEYISVQYPYSYTIPRATAIDQSYPFTANPGTVVPMAVKFRNDSSFTWTSNINLAIDHEQNEAFLQSFHHPSWLSANRIASLPASTAPGATVTYNFNVTTPYLSPGTYRFFVRLVDEGKSWFGPGANGGAWWYVTIPDQTPRATAVDQSPSFTASPGTVVPMAVKFRNDSSFTWNSNINLATDREQSESIMQSYRDSSWLSADRIATLPQSTAPGATATYNFKVRVPNLPAGTHRFYVRLVYDGVSWFGPGVNGGAWWYVTIPDQTPRARAVDQTVAATGHPGDIVHMGVIFRNDSAFTWTSNINLATDREQSEAFMQSFRAPSWLSPDRIAALPHTTAPGATATYNFDIRIPNLPPGQYRFYARLVHDGVGWFGPEVNGGAWWYVNVQ